MYTHLRSSVVWRHLYLQSPFYCWNRPAPCGCLFLARTRASVIGSARLGGGLYMLWNDVRVCACVYIISCSLLSFAHTATHCNSLHYTATHCDTLQHATTRCNTLFGNDVRVGVCISYMHTCVYVYITIYIHVCTYISRMMCVFVCVCQVCTRVCVYISLCV